MNTITPLTKQEIFSKVWEHFIINEEPISHSEDQCRYRHEGNKCAIGLFIPDEFYHPSLEANDVAFLTEKVPYMKELFSGVDLQFLKDIQKAHDHDSSGISDIVDNLEDIAKDYNLSIPEDTD